MIGKKRLYRTEGPDAKIAGVCGGLAEYLNIDPVFVRFVTIVLVLFASVGIWIYIAGIFIIPKKSDLASRY
ncbi:MAG: PspC domain-containing protein [Kiritimatiellia bacterium]